MSKTANLVRPYNGILLSNKNQNFNPCNNIGESQKHFQGESTDINIMYTI
jgi:hypothetical protein